ncbi:AbrB/MazE/SpoVT family DNA-binding domain-containing protein [Actinobacillus vicugnae]|uniref:AbrB/MazE/SpoVT family DNA-binding domain-containing protein n=1 Tax=Actinobacillus vicugnae TaxID=2573093 RepID=UPI0012400EFD|nr:AbrB/MazE/SpoVT family DNA-binding domain-containing protein [Actinobacillus vicugnae]
MQVQIKKWGNSAAVRIPQAILAQLQWQENDSCDIEVLNDSLVLRSLKPKKKYDLKTLLAEMPEELPMVENWDTMPDAGLEK